MEPPFRLMPIPGLSVGGTERCEAVWTFAGHAVSLSSQRTRLWHRLLAQDAKPTALGQLPCAAVSVNFVVMSGILKLLVALSSGRVHCWDWSLSSLAWESGISFVCAGVQNVVALSWSAEYASLVCLEATEELECTVSRVNFGGSNKVVLGRVACDAGTAALFVQEHHVWINSFYGGLCCIKLGDKQQQPFPPALSDGLLVELHPMTRQLVSYSRQSGELRLHRPLSEPALLSRLPAALGPAVTGMRLMYAFVVLLLRDGKCVLHDLESGVALASLDAGPDLRLACHGGRGLPPVVLWSPTSWHALRQGPVASVAALLPPARAIRLAEDWGLKKVAAHHALESHDSVALLRYAATPALSVACVAVQGQEPPQQLVQHVDQQLHSRPKGDALAAAKETFHRLSTLTPTVQPLLDQWLASATRVNSPFGEEAASLSSSTAGLADDEALEVLALEDPARALQALHDAGPPASPDDDRFPLYCRLLAECDEDAFRSFLSQQPPTVARAVQDCTLPRLHAAERPELDLMSGPPQQVLRNLRANANDGEGFTVADFARVFDKKA